MSSRNREQPEIREALETDVAGVLRIYSDSGIDGDQSFSEEEARDHLARFRSYPSYRLFVAVMDSEIVGTYSLLILDHMAKRGRRAGIVEDVAVLPHWQRRGVGRAMMEHALEQCRQSNCYKLTLSSNLQREAAHRFYDSLGFERHGYSFIARLGT